jgi:hypothetical protein
MTHCPTHSPTHSTAVVKPSVLLQIDLLAFSSHLLPFFRQASMRSETGLRRLHYTEVQGNGHDHPALLRVVAQTFGAVNGTVSGMQTRRPGVLALRTGSAASFALWTSLRQRFRYQAKPSER